MVGNTIKKEEEKKLQELSINVRSDTGSLKVSDEKKTSITKIKCFLQHWKKSGRQVMQKIINMSLECRSWRHVIHGHVQVPLSTDQCPQSLAWINRKLQNLTLQWIWQTVLFLAVFMTNFKKKIITFLLLNFDVKASVKFLRVVPCLQCEGLVLIYRLVQLFSGHGKSMSLCSFLVEQVWWEIQTV